MSRCAAPKRQKRRMIHALTMEVSTLKSTGTEIVFDNTLGEYRNKTEEEIAPHVWTGVQVFIKPSSSAVADNVFNIVSDNEMIDTTKEFEEPYSVDGDHASYSIVDIPLLPGHDKHSVLALLQQQYAQACVSRGCVTL